MVIFIEKEIENVVQRKAFGCNLRLILQRIMGRQSKVCFASVRCYKAISLPTSVSLWWARLRKSFGAPARSSSVGPTSMVKQPL